MRHLIYLPLFITFLNWVSNTQTQKVDLIIHNSKIYTIDEKFSIVEAMAIDHGRIIEVGSSSVILEKYSSENIIDAKGKFIYPGLIDAHAHFYYYGKSLQEVNLVGTKSWDECIEKVNSFPRQPDAVWTIGRGWDQNDWTNKEFPNNARLNQLFPNRPVLLSRIDGHAAIANEVALKLAGIFPNQQIEGGQILMDDKGHLTGLLIDNAVDLVMQRVPPPTEAQQIIALQKAEQNCFAVGLTSVVDCGLDYPLVELIDRLQKDNQLKIRLDIMLSDSLMNYEYLFKKGVIKTDRLRVGSFKIYSDGALGSRGACLKSDYHDKEGWRGFLLKDRKHFEEVAHKLADSDFQMCTHAIGDSSNHVILSVYGEVLGKNNDRRWRIEHAQVVDEVDFDYFKKYSIVPSVQPTHATSDMYWAEDRLGKDRIQHAYSYLKLQKQLGWLPLGTDFPVEDISPFYTFYAAVARRDASGFPADGFQLENALSRQDALRGMTIWAAKGSFEEHEKGSLEIGKFADFIILDTDLMHDELLKCRTPKVLATYLQGERVFSK
ncbi:MAG: amidohydrolase [Saprospiraceae bacterium]|nr:amidohydrolase [Saprospiraceae bacterium]